MDQETIEKNKDLIKIIIILIIVIIAATVGKKIIDSILEAIGLKKSDEDKFLDKKAEVQEQLAVDFFNPKYYKNYPNGYERDPSNISLIKAKEVAAKIWGAIGTFYDSPDQIRGAFSAAKTKADVSKISDAFYNKYKKDMLIWLSDKLDTEKQKQNWILILKELNKLPQGFKQIKK